MKSLFLIHSIFPGTAELTAFAKTQAVQTCCASVPKKLAHSELFNRVKYLARTIRKFNLL